MQAFKDTSAFMGYMKYFDEKGTEWRREVSWEGLYKFYKLCGDAFIFDGVCRMKYKGIKKAHEYYIQGNGYHDLSVECED